MNRLSLALALLAAAAAQAHISTSAPVFANTTQEVTFSVGHGCTSTTDTYSVKLDIPAGVTSVRPLTSDFGAFTVSKDGSLNVTSVTWTKPLANLRDDDAGYYKLSVRLKTPNLPFTNLYFAVHQTCRDAAGNTTTTDWVGTPNTIVPDGGTAPEPAASVALLPARVPGWNKYQSTEHIHDASLAVFFKDAVIVWKGNAAYSFNPNATTQIKGTAGVTVLSEIHPDDEIWVKY